jgi:AcrR family transcriptional regulator
MYSARVQAVSDARAHLRPARRPRGSGEGRDLREAVLSATVVLLDRHRFADLTVGDILAEARVARGSFYFYFSGKQDVLAELVRRAVSAGQAAAEPWLGDPLHPADALRAGIADGARLWQDNAAVLRAIVENWRSDPDLTALWLDQMNGFTEATITRLRRDPDLTARFDEADLRTLASSLTWLGERLYYLAAVGVPPFDDHDRLVATLWHVWTATLSCPRPTNDERAP